MLQQLPSLKQYTFWDQKVQFLLSCDRYPHWVMFVVEKGTFRYRIDDEDNLASRGEIVICPPYTDFHREMMTQTLTFHFIRFDWMEQDRIFLLRTFLMGNSKQVFKPHDYERLLSTCRHLRQAFEREGETSSFASNHYLSDILFLLYVESKQAELHRNSVADFLMDDAKTYIAERAFRPLHIQDVAAALNISKVQLTRRFRASFHMKPIDYLTQLRMARVKQLLIETEYTIDHIAGLCGYDNGFYLSRVFSQRFDETPSQYRIKHRL
jgi:AraC family transcriptional regulator